MDTGFASYRTFHFARFPVTGPPEPQGTRAAYDARVADLVATGMISDASHLYWDARPSTRFPTLEVRIADSMPLLDDVVLHTGLVRALVRSCASEAERGEPVPDLAPELARAVRWRAARYGLDGELVDARARVLRPAAELVEQLLTRLRPALEDTGDWDEVRALTDGLLARGTSAQRQRRTARESGELSAVTAAVVAEVEG
jgi:carboxylate-amine ligase